MSRTLCVILALMAGTGAAWGAVPAVPAAVKVAPVHLGRNAEEIAETDEIITQIIPLQALASQELVATLLPFVPEGTLMAANVGSNSIIITERSAVVKRLVRIICYLDLPNGNVIEMRRLQNADAAETARLINALFGQ